MSGGSRWDYRVWLPVDPPREVCGLAVLTTITRPPGSRNLLIRKWCGRELVIQSFSMIPRKDAVVIQFAVKRGDAIYWIRMSPERIEQLYP